MKRVLVAGATGYLGMYLLKELKSQDFETTALVRNPKKLEGVQVYKIIESEVTKRESLEGVFDEIDCVISTIGITRQKDGLTYMDVDYQANMNLLVEALRAGVKKFVYVSVLNGQTLKNLKMVEAKERFVDQLKSSGISYSVIRPNGFFSDMKEVLDMAVKGKVYLFGKGNFKANPIHGADLAKFIVDHIDCHETELEIGGPDVMTQNEIAETAFMAANKSSSISYIPAWIGKLVVSLTRIFTNQKIYGPIEFFITVMSRDMVAPITGEHHLIDFYKEEMSQN